MEGDAHVYETLDTASSETPPPLSPAVVIEETTDLLGEILKTTEKENLDMPWDMAAGNRLSKQFSVHEGGSVSSAPGEDDDEEFSLVCLTFFCFVEIVILFYLVISQ